jgi:hypothetical protein
MIDPAAAPAWGIAALKWLRELPETIRAWGRSNRYPAVTIVPQRQLYHEITRFDGSTIGTDLILDCLITNGSEDRSLLIPRLECHVHGFGTVKGVGLVVEIPPGHSSHEQLIFGFSRALNKPRGCTIILFDQFAKKHRKWIKLHYGGPADPI